MRSGGVPTLKDVAAAAGVSVMTASNAVNGRPRVAPATRQRVLDAVDALGYEVNLTARRLRAGRSGTIALAVPRLDHPYFGDLAARFATALAPGGRHLVDDCEATDRLLVITGLQPGWRDAEGVPAVHPSHVGPFVMETPMVPGLSWPSRMLGGAGAS